MTKTQDKPLQANIRAIVRELMKWEDITQKELAQRLNMQPPQMSKRMATHGSDWTAEDIGALAIVFGVDEGLFYRDATTVIRNTANVIAALDVSALPRFAAREQPSRPSTWTPAPPGRQRHSRELPAATSNRSGGRVAA